MQQSNSWIPKKSQMKKCKFFPIILNSKDQSAHEAFIKLTTSFNFRNFAFTPTSFKLQVKSRVDA